VTTSRRPTPGRDIDASAPIPPRRIAERVDQMDVESRSSVFLDRRIHLHNQPRGNNDLSRGEAGGAVRTDLDRDAGRSPLMGSSRGR
jgi:hypothetical protein